MMLPLEQCMVRLQAAKEEQYGTEWKKRGFVSAYFNTGRKLERIVTMWNAGWKSSKDDDTRLDTLVDFLNYSILNLLLHIEKFPDVGQKLFELYNHSFSVSVFSANKEGFQYFCENFLWEMLAKDLSSKKQYEELMNELIILSQNTIDGWLDQLAAVSEEKAIGNTLYESDFSPKMRMEHLTSVIVGAYQVLLHHVLLYPDEWNMFVRRYSFFSSLCQQV